MATTTATVTARTQRRCDGYRCPTVIQPGQQYARHVAFPGDDVNQGRVPLVLRLCQNCHTAHGQPMPPRRRKARQLVLSLGEHR